MDDILDNTDILYTKYDKKFKKLCLILKHEVSVNTIGGTTINEVDCDRSMIMVYLSIT